MTKKDKILLIFSEKNWHDGVKILTYEDFQSEGLCPTMEYGEKYNDIIYARRIFQQMGYSVSIGSAMYIRQKP